MSYNDIEEQAVLDAEYQAALLQEPWSFNMSNYGTGVLGGGGRIPVLQKGFIGDHPGLAIGISSAGLGAARGLYTGSQTWSGKAKSKKPTFGSRIKGALQGATTGAVGTAAGMGIAHGISNFGKTDYGYSGNIMPRLFHKPRSGPKRPRVKTTVFLGPANLYGSNMRGLTSKQINGGANFIKVDMHLVKAQEAAAKGLNHVAEYHEMMAEAQLEILNKASEPKDFGKFEEWMGLSKATRPSQSERVGNSIASGYVGAGLGLAGGQLALPKIGRMAAKRVVRTGMLGFKLAHHIDKYADKALDKDNYKLAESRLRMANKAEAAGVKVVSFGNKIKFKPHPVYGAFAGLGAGLYLAHKINNPQTVKKADKNDFGRDAAEVVGTGAAGATGAYAAARYAPKVGRAFDNAAKLVGAGTKAEHVIREVAHPLGAGMGGKAALLAAGGVGGWLANRKKKQVVKSDGLNSVSRKSLQQLAKDMGTAGVTSGATNMFNMAFGVPGNSNPQVEAHVNIGNHFASGWHFANGNPPAAPIASL